MALHTVPWDGPVPDVCRGGAVTLGNFDGVHRGHAALLAELRGQAQRVRGPAVALTFDPHPLHLLRPESRVPVLTTLPRRAELLQEAGADHVLILTTTPAMLQVGAAEFYTKVIRNSLAVRAVAEGENFRFGRNREGTVATLATLCAADAVQLSIVPPLLIDGEPVSSSRVRTLITQGQVRAAAELLGRPHALEGIVGKGQQRGRLLRFPTANLEHIVTLIPGDGVYAVRVHVGPTVWPGAANVGPNPTFGEQARKVEVHLLDFEGDLYDRALRIDFIDRLRDTRAFAKGEELTAQLHRDVAQARRILQPRAEE